jgi:hypothetical protein
MPTRRAVFGERVEEREPRFSSSALGAAPDHSVVASYLPSSMSRRAWRTPASCTE